MAYNFTMKAVLLLSLILVIISNSISAEKCYDEKRGTRISQVPQDLPAEIRCLDLSSNRIKNITSDSFKRYRYLRILNLNNNNIKSDSAEPFSNLGNLIELNLAKNHITNLRNLPASLETLVLDDNIDLFTENVDSVNWSTLKSLKVLRLENTGLKNLSTLVAVGGSLETLYIASNENLNPFSVSDLSSFCKLKKLNLSLNDDGFKMNGDVCQCREVKNWISEYNIKNANIICNEEKLKLVKCKQTNVDTFGNRSKCIVSSAWKKYWIYGAAFFVVVCFFTCCSYACRRMKCNKITSLEEDT